MKARQNAGLDSPEAVRGEQERKREEHAETMAQAHTANSELNNLEAAQSAYDKDEQQASAAYARTVHQLTEARQASEQAAEGLGAAEGYLKGLLLRVHADGHCPRCDLALPQREEGHCAVCDQIVATTAKTDWPGLLSEAREGVEAAKRARAKCRLAVEEAEKRSHAAWAALEEAKKHAATHREKTAPVRALVRALEKRAEALSGELIQLAKRLEELAVIVRLEKDLLECHRAMKAAERERDAARAERQERRTDITAQWARHVLARLKAILPDTREISIDPHDYSIMVDGKAFDEISVAGGPKTALNVAVLLSLQDLARTRPGILIPSMMIIDAPLTGFSSEGLDHDTSRRMMDQILGAAESTSADGLTSQVITAVNYRLPSQRSSDLQEIALSTTNRFIEHAPARSS
ncbi:hypothetical protein AB0G48_17975 [Streptomyces rubiginosohelvolus]|uniref:hypothetical protein n=1 Tax=Streptomyces rubiginosohelvolus TaxID=67362 RepID=UPI0033CAF0E1